MTTCDIPELKLISSADAKAVKNFVREIFVESEPINKYLISKECKDFRYFDRVNAIGDCIDEGLSYKFVNKSGEIVAIGLVEAKINSPRFENPSPIFLKLILFFEMVEEEVKKIVNVTETDNEVRFWILSVHPDWRGKGLAKSLLVEVMSSLKPRGFTHISAFCTSAYSTKLFVQCGFEKLYSIKYSDYTPNGEVVFLPDEPHTHLNVMRLKL